MLNAFFQKLGMRNLRFKPAFNPYTEPSMEVFAYHDGLQRWIEVHSLYRSATFKVKRFVLFSSRPLKGGGPYGIEESYALRSPMEAYV